MTGTSPLAVAPPVRPLPEVLEAARQVNCGHCWKEPGPPCATSPAGADGVHVARLDRAFRRGLVSGPELVAVLQALETFTSATVVFDVPPEVV
jgi:hypothetical protein